MPVRDAYERSCNALGRSEWTKFALDTRLERSLPRYTPRTIRTAGMSVVPAAVDGAGV